ncbi:hypothetical protein D3C86_1303640 [compost metagenome]
MASSSPLSLAATCALKRAAWSSASFSSLKPLPNSRPVMYSSKRSVTSGRSSLARASGEISVGCSMMKVGCQSFSSTVSSKYITCRLARLRCESLSFSSLRPSLRRALMSQAVSSTPSPASVCLRIASRIVRRSKGCVRSTALPP